MRKVAADFRLMNDTGFLLARGSGLAVRTTNARLAHLGLRARHYSVLSLTCDGAGISQRELSDFLGLDPSQVVALIDALQSQGLVERQPHPNDRRTRLVVATHKGRALRDRAQADVDASREEFLKALTMRERKVLLDLLRRLAFPVADFLPETGSSETDSPETGTAGDERTETH